MPTDLELTTGFDIYIEGSNDLATISGDDQLEQSVALDVRNVTKALIGGRLTGQNIGLLEERVERSLAADEQLSSVQTVNVTRYSQETQTVTMEVIVIDDEDFELEVSI